MIVYIYEVDSRTVITIKKVDNQYEIEFQQEGYDIKLFSDISSKYDIVDRSIIDSYNSNEKINRVINMTVIVEDYISPEDLFFLVEYV